MKEILENYFVFQLRGSEGVTGHVAVGEGLRMMEVTAE